MSARRKMELLIDCGSASEKTKGVPFLLFFELSWPPFDRLYFF